MLSHWPPGSTWFPDVWIINRRHSFYYLSHLDIELMSAQVESSTKTTIKISSDFWHTGVGILVKRVAFQAAAALALVAADALMTEHVEWAKVLYAAQWQMGYILLSTVQTYRDPQIPNLPSDVITVQK